MARVSGVAVSNALVSDIGGVRVRAERKDGRAWCLAPQASGAGVVSDTEGVKHRGVGTRCQASGRRVPRVWHRRRSVPRVWHRRRSGRRCGV
ncbi:MAG: hypothetical protein LBK25_09495 [Treponema sp.]|nr:hypothetical protein [Treponema sp.]